MQNYPAYRLMDGRIVCQEMPGARWSVIDDKGVNDLLKMLGGVTLDSIQREAANGKLKLPVGS